MRTGTRPLAFLLAALFAAAAFSAEGAVGTFQPSEKSIFDPSCWKSVMEAPSCLKDLATFFTTFPFRLGTECCEAIHGIDDRCLKLPLPLPLPILQLGDIIDRFTAAYCPAH